jgi:predicted RNA-binding Zn-ribbon protein involved in translation (DUF1610 family)
MSGHILKAHCVCGFTGTVKVGFEEPSAAFPQGRELVAAFDSETESLVAIERQEAKRRGMPVYEDPYQQQQDASGNPITPPGDQARFLCPECMNNIMWFELLGSW